MTASAIIVVPNINQKEAAERRPMFPKEKRIIDKKYIEWIKSLNCCVTGARDPDPHHVNPQGGGGIGTKCSDRRAIPLSHFLHQEIHQIGKITFAEKYDLDYEDLIAQLNKKYDEKRR